MSERVSIDEQISEVSLVIVNRKAWLGRREELTRQGKTLPPDTGCTAATLPGLEAALRTLEWVRDHHAKR
ncbi:hypothetical protein ACFQE0_26040 [Methylobacterium komagatae]|uniref:DUF2384 domain-containing protein n=1 Tax=Methylobacterium komagatae TaxID=374425 RepID=A0ABW2BQF0_9HYPH